jgi:hypothetical protein
MDDEDSDIQETYADMEKSALSRIEGRVHEEGSIVYEVST